MRFRARAPVRTGVRGEQIYVQQIYDDLETVGLKNDRIVVKSDQENSVADMSREIARIRGSDYGTAVENSSVGQSDTNATVESAIQDVHGQARTLRAALEQRMSSAVGLDMPILPWMVRHAG